jgi:fructose-1,6-bisphosphatase I
MSRRGKTVNQEISRSERQQHGHATGEFSLLLSEIIVTGKIIREKITLAGIAEVLGSTDEENVQGETVAILDKLSNEILIERLIKSGLVCMVVSEELEQPCYPSEKYQGGKYVVSCDPCDGSSNIACNVPVGTIFGIWNRLSPRDQPATLEDALQPGRDMVCAGYIVYGPSTMLVYSIGSEVTGFTYDPSIGEFILTHPHMEIPTTPKCYSVNEAYWNYWDEATKEYVSWLRDAECGEHAALTGRYVGSLVSDFHRNLLYGGVYLYPTDLRSKTGKLRLLYECAPLSFIAEKAGGRGSNGYENILDIVPTGIHQRVPLYIGNTDLVLKAEALKSHHENQN